MLGEAYFALGAARRAHAAFTRAATLDPGDWLTWVELAGVASGRERRTAIEHAARLDPLAVHRVEP